jgi:hypothetical protein
VKLDLDIIRKHLDPGAAGPRGKQRRVLAGEIRLSD